ncbi:MAG TPA: cyanophycin synthetase, partial [Thermoplasmata archaeon]|nr:cyanophycin synthetase [Thermoplasmata archaeon]
EEHQTFTVRTPHRDHPDLRLPLRGAFQARNAALAVAAVDLFAEARGVEVPESAVRAGLAGVRWRARLERVERGPDLYLDVAHTPESARAVAEGLGEDRPDLDPEENVLVFGCLSGKRVPEMLEPLSTLARTIVVVPVRSERSAPVDELRRAALGRFPRILLAPGALDGLALARAATGDDGFTLVTGSDYLAGEVLRAREGGAEEEPDLSDPGVVPRTDGASR